MLKRQNLEAPQSTLSCCTTRAKKRRDGLHSEINTSRVPDDSSGLLGQFGIDMNPDFGVLTDTNLQNPELNGSYSYPSLEGEDPFHGLGADPQSHAMTPESMNHTFGPLGLRRGSTMDMARSQPSSSCPTTVDLNHETFDFHMQDAMPRSLSYPQTQPTGPSNWRRSSTVDAPQNTHGTGHSNSNAFEWPIVLDPGPLQHQQQSPSSAGTNISSSPATPNLQTTIRLESADPSTVFAVIGILIESKAKFKFETH
ncbi:MAG: hypothetical protein ALECFALPRED_003324 [Alectoria fallacina]|uniref:Uncharacterized protein n=1 Tax=Alectoria fallacina TaxID=1903189 RepID=A0A8H3EKE4_9LECA|nr:MAG: hypothetical protein ALECFALPRED_003324 [Alectoria fallacina]